MRKRSSWSACRNSQVCQVAGMKVARRMRQQANRDEGKPAYTDRGYGLGYGLIRDGRGGRFACLVAVGMVSTLAGMAGRAGVCAGERGSLR